MRYLVILCIVIAAVVGGIYVCSFTVSEREYVVFNTVWQADADNKNGRI